MWMQNTGDTHLEYGITMCSVPDPDPVVRGMDLDPDPSTIKQK
jgi:hypothetical protein